MLHTYRSRLIVYLFLLMTFLVATLSYSYIAARDTILKQSARNISNTARLITSNIKMEENELQHYASVIRDDPRIQEYMFIITNVGADTKALTQLFNRSFSWLPIKRSVFINSQGRAQLNNDNPGLAAAVQENIQAPGNGIFYFYGKYGLEMVAWASISYQNSALGTVAISRLIDKKWLSQQQNYSGSHLFIEKNNVVQLSTLRNSLGKTFRPYRNSIVINEHIYQVHAIPLSNEDKNSPHLWQGTSEHDVLSQLAKHSRQIFLLTILGSAAILLVGLVLARNFSTPLKQLTKITDAVSQGSIPDLKKSSETNELASLANHFSEMLNSLRKQQQEIDLAHKKLEQSAIIDSLTHLYNRRYLEQAFPKLLAQSQRDNHYLSGLMLDLDFFKKINDRHGHLAGDQCLSEVGRILKESCRASDYVFRMGGEEFLILSLVDNPQKSEQLAEKIRNRLEQSPILYKDRHITMTISIGLCQADNNLNPDAALTNLLFHTDTALYAAKHKGRNQVVSYEGGQLRVPSSTGVTHSSEGMRRGDSEPEA
jgi:diguanylate cyclase (GGDEF)-like protein